MLYSDIIAKDGVYFSELSPRPHDTGMVTLANTQNYNEFELHARAILSIPVPEIKLLKWYLQLRSLVVPTFNI